MASAPVSAVPVRTSCNNKGDSVVLPEFMALRSPNNNKFLGYRPGPDYRSFLRFQDDDIWSPYVKLQVVTDQESGFVSVRSCYNNRFWRRQDDKHWWIVAGEDSPNTDQSSASCTLFDFSYDTTDKILSLRLVQLNKNAADWRVGGELDRCLFAGETPGSLDSYAKFVVFDMRLMVRLPKRVIFKGDNGMYLRNYNGVYSFSGSDFSDETAIHTVQWTAEGNMSLHWKQLSCFLGFTYDDAIGLAKITPAVFQPVKVDDRTVALRCLDNSCFCRRFTDKVTNWLFANTNTIDSPAHLVVGEPVISRRVYSIEFDIDGAYIYGCEPILLDHVKASNETSETSSMEVAISYTKTSTQSWNNGFTFTGDIGATFQTGIPLIVEGKIKVSPLASYKHGWGGKITEEEKVESTYTVTVDAGKAVYVDAVATNAKCDVKFSYIQADFLTNGEKFVTKMSGGVFLGMNYFNFEYRVYPAE